MFLSYISIIYFPAFRYVLSFSQVSLHVNCIHRNQEQAEDLGCPLISDSDDVSGTDNMCYTLIGLPLVAYVSFYDMMQGDNVNIKE